MKHLLNFLGSLAISIVVLLMAKAIGWISFGQSLPVVVAPAFWNQIIWLAILAAIFTAAGHIIGKLYGLVIIGTLGCGCLLFPAVILLAGYFKLWAASLLIPGFTYTSVWWQVLPISFFVGINFEGAPTATTTQSTTQHES